MQALRFMALVLFSVALLAPRPQATACAESWPRRTIDASSRGADGVRLADANGDELMDIATPWEEDGLTRVYLNPGPERARYAWPMVTVGQASSPEDAVLVDLDGDGAMDVVTCCEGTERTVYVHWAPREGSRFLDSAAWQSAALDDSINRMQWMFCLPMDVDGDGALELVAGGKNAGAEIGWFERPSDPRDMAGWKWRALGPVGWVMSIIEADMNGDGRTDILFSDRLGAFVGVRWYLRPASPCEWVHARFPFLGEEPMFMELKQDGAGTAFDMFVAISGPSIAWLQGRADASPAGWRRTTLALPSGAGTGKAVAVSDLDGDGVDEIIFTCEKAEQKSGVMYLRQNGGEWTAHDVSGAEGAKYDLVVPIDLDGDGDPDLLTCEERDGLGVIWYENPARTPATR